MTAIGYQVILSEGFREDMEECRRRDGYAAASISVHLRELRDNAHLCECLVDEHFSDDKIDSVVPLWSLQRRGLNAYRVKYIELGRWRVITGVDRRIRRIGLFAVMPREADYQNDAALWNRIEQEYDELGFHRLGR